MMIPTEGSQELNDAFRHVRDDLRERAFYRHPSDLEIVTSHRFEWLAGLQAQLDRETYVPRPVLRLSVPKADWHVRPAAVLTLEDHAVYNYLALSARTQIAPQLSWSERKGIRFSNHIELRRKRWFRRSFVGWKAFDKSSLRRTDKKTHVLVTDIAGYYENIDIGRLVQDLRAVGVEPAVAKLLSSCLNKWAGRRGKGIPQGYSASDLFAEFYLNTVDLALDTEGFDHTRYLDDFRVFAESKQTAIRALHRLLELVREQGLILQTAKSQILEAKQAHERFSAVDRMLSAVSQRIGSELEGLIGADPYVTPQALRAYIRSDPSDPAPPVVETAWQEFESGVFGAFNKSVFHYLLSRLSELKSRVAVPFVLRQLSERPEETVYCLDYLAAQLDAVRTEELDQVAAALTDSGNVYEYQRYLVLRWFSEGHVENTRVLGFCRRLLSNPAAPPLLLAHASVYLGEFSNGLHDYQRLESALHADADPVRRGAYLCALRSAPRELRNRIFGRTAGESPYLDWAIEFAKQDG